MINLQVTKIANKNYLFFPNSKSIRYSIIITNRGDEIANCIKVKDVISENIYVDIESIKVNGCHQDGYDFNKGIRIASLKPGENSVVSFDVCIDKRYIPDNIYNKAIVSYCDAQNNIITIESNELIIPVINIDVCLTKSVDKSVASVGEVLEYYILIRNNSTIKITDVIFYDILSVCAEIIPSSVIIDSKVRYLSSMSNGVEIGTINSKSSMVISFQVAIKCMCYPSVITNIARIDYSYTVVDNGMVVTSIGESISNKVVTKVLESRC